MAEQTFQAWLSELRALPSAVEFGYDGSEGDECWQGYYDGGYRPVDALAEDLSYD